MATVPSRSRTQCLSITLRARAKRGSQHSRLLGHPQRAAHLRRAVSACARSSDGESADTFALAPSKPQTPFGQMLAYYLQMQPELFESALEDQFERLQQEREASSSEAESPPSEADATSSLSLTRLSDRIREVQGNEMRATVEDLMYVSILGEFLKLGVTMLPRADDQRALEPMSLAPLMDGVHSKEALVMVREHLMKFQGNTSMLPPTTEVRMAKLQLFQLYGASVAFGYFLRRVDRRFQLARSLGMLPENKEDAVDRLERLFNQASNSDSMDSAGPASSDAASDAASSNASSSGADSVEDNPIRRYILSFDEDTLREVARMMTAESNSIMHRQCVALYGDPARLQAQFQKVLGEVGSMEELEKRMEAAVANQEVETVQMSLGSQRRVVLEAVAFGAFLRDVEVRVDNKYDLLTPLPTGPQEGGGGAPGMLPM